MAAFFPVYSYAQNPGGVNASVLWLRADLQTSTTTDGAALSTWNDQSSSGNQARQTTTALTQNPKTTG